MCNKGLNIQCPQVAYNILLYDKTSIWSPNVRIPLVLSKIARRNANMQRVQRLIISIHTEHVSALHCALQIASQTQHTCTLLFTRHKYETQRVHNKPPCTGVPAVPACFVSAFCIRTDADVVHVKFDKPKVAVIYMHIRQKVR